MAPNKANAHIYNKKFLLATGGVFTFILIGVFISLGFVGIDQVTNTDATPSTMPFKNSQTHAAATSILSFRQLAAGSTAVLLDTGNHPSTAVQLEISFDPDTLRNISIKPGNFFDQALILMSNIDYTNGSIFFAIVTPPQGMPKMGKGIIATLDYNFTPGATNPTSLQFLPRTKVASIGINQSVLKSASGITIATASL